ncbi:MAG: DUF354 domain-containing protein [Thermoplasmatota archaeon]
MKIVFTIQHPAHVHFFKYAIKELRDTHEIKVFVRDKEIITDLLDAYDINHTVLSTAGKSSFGMFSTQLKYEYKIWEHTKESPPDLFCAIGGTAASHVSKLLDSKSIVFTDTEHARLQNNITFPFADSICTPDCYKDDLGSKQIRYPGYHELAYLHPNRFKPDSSVLDYIDANEDDKIVILRLISWGAAHDVGHSGFRNITDVVNQLESTGAKVVITAEGDIPDEVEHCQSTIPPHKMHDLMYYSYLFIGESGTMVTESAILGTPAIFVSSLNAGVWDELENKYGLLNHFSKKNRQKESVKKAVSILENYGQDMWRKRQQSMLEDKIDVTNFILNLFKEIEKDIE